MKRAWRRLIKGHYWTIRLVTAREMRRHSGPGRRAFGLTLMESREILILDTLKGAELLTVIHHEWQHAERDDADHRKVHRQSVQLAGVIAAVVHGAHEAEARK